MKWPVSSGIYLYWPTTTKWNRFPKVTLRHSVTGNVNFIFNGTKKIKVLPQEQYLGFLCFSSFLLSTLWTWTNLYLNVNWDNKSGVCVINLNTYWYNLSEYCLAWNWLKIYISCIFIRNLIMDFIQFLCKMRSLFLQKTVGSKFSQKRAIVYLKLERTHRIIESNSGLLWE